MAAIIEMRTKYLALVIEVINGIKGTLKQVLD